MAEGKFVTAINCMDGRVQEPVNNYLKKMHGADYVDVITEPGPIKILAEQEPGSLMASLRTRVDISVNKHGSKVIAVVGHHDCAGNPFNKEIQLEQIEKAVKTVSSWGFGTEIVKLFVNNNWEIEKL